MTVAAHSDFTTMPRFFVTLKVGPSSAFAATAPRQTMMRGCTSAISLASHGKHARTSERFGVLWMRRFDFVSRAHLKCFTAFVR